MFAKRRLNMAAPRIISAWTILLHIGTGDVQINDNGIITWKRFSYYWSSVRGGPLITSGPHRKGPVIFSMVRKKAVGQTVELYIIWDAPKSMSRYYNGAWAGLMWSILYLISYPNIAWHQFIISYGLYIYGQDGGIHLRLPVHIE